MMMMNDVESLWVPDRSLVKLQNGPMVKLSYGKKRAIKKKNPAVLVC